MQQVVRHDGIAPISLIVFARAIGMLIYAYFQRHAQGAPWWQVKSSALKCNNPGDSSANDPMRVISQQAALNLNPEPARPYATEASRNCETLARACLLDAVARARPPVFRQHSRKHSQG
jgi:hypothetical protein